MKSRCLAFISAALSVSESTIAHTGTQNALARSHGKVWHASALLEKLFILRQLLQNFSLPQRKLHGPVLVVEGYHEILDLKCISARAHERSTTLTIPHRPTAVRLVPCPWLFAILRVVAATRSENACLNRTSFMYLDAPASHMVRCFLCFRPCQRRSHGSGTGQNVLSLSYTIVKTYSKPIFAGYVARPRNVSQRTNCSLTLAHNVVEGCNSLTVQSNRFCDCSLAARSSVTAAFSFKVAYSDVYGSPVWRNVVEVGAIAAA